MRQRTQWFQRDPSLSSLFGPFTVDRYFLPAGSGHALDGLSFDSGRPAPYLSSNSSFATKHSFPRVSKSLLRCGAPPRLLHGPRSSMTSARSPHHLQPHHQELPAPRRFVQSSTGLPFLRPRLQQSCNDARPSENGSQATHPFFGPSPSQRAGHFELRYT